VAPLSLRPQQRKGLSPPERLTRAPLDHCSITPWPHHARSSSTAWTSTLLSWESELAFLRSADAYQSKTPCPLLERLAAVDELERSRLADEVVDGYRLPDSKPFAVAGRAGGSTRRARPACRVCRGARRRELRGLRPGICWTRSASPDRCRRAERDRIRTRFGTTIDTNNLDSQPYRVTRLDFRS